MDDGYLGGWRWMNNGYLYRRTDGWTMAIWMNGRMDRQWLFGRMDEWTMTIWGDKHMDG